MNLGVESTLDRTHSLHFPIFRCTCAALDIEIWLNWNRSTHWYGICFLIDRYHFMLNIHLLENYYSIEILLQLVWIDFKMFVSMYLWIIFDNQSAAPTTIWARNCLLNETKCLGENELVHTHRQESGQILWQWEVRKYYDKGDSVRVNWPKVASSAKAECGRNSDSTRSMFLLLATPSSLPTSTSLSSLPSWRRGLDKGSIASQQILAVNGFVFGN